jgi:glycosyltransferase involved in cell wall biosynthesis
VHGGIDVNIGFVEGIDENGIRKKTQWMKYRLYLLKRRFENLFILPFIMAGRLRARIYPLQAEYEVFFFFPFYHTGGAEKVHALISYVLKNRKSIVIFTRKSHNDGFRALFSDSGHDIIDISSYTDNKVKYWNNLVWRGVVTGHINRQRKRPKLFNGQCNFAYKCAPWVHSSIKQYELIHSFNSFSWIRIPFIPYYTSTVMISRKAMTDHYMQYMRLGIPDALAARICYIRNGIMTPPDVSPKETDDRPLSVIYVGRGTSEKRVHIILSIARACQDAGLPVKFTFVGDLSNLFKGRLPANCKATGNLNDPVELDHYYRAADVLMLTSSEEGFPMVVMEAMARGCIILSTPVGELPEHIMSNETGFLFSSITDEKTIEQEGVIWIKYLISHPDMCRSMSSKCILYARKHFGIDQFEQEYRALLTR